MTDGVLLEAQRLVAGYQRRPVVGPFDLTLRDDTAVALVGSNGVGKSTILKTLAGVIPPVGGTVTYKGRAVPESPVYVHARQGLVLVGEHRANVFRTLTVGENLDLAVSERRHESSLDPFDLFPRLRDRRGQLAGTLSGGELQMLSLSMALALAPRCLLLDEPSAGLAPIVLDDVRQAVERLRVAGLSLVVAEQRPDVVRGLCDRVAVVAAGKLTYLGAGTELSRQTLMATYFSDDHAG